MQQDNFCSVSLSLASMSLLFYFNKLWLYCAGCDGVADGVDLMLLGCWWYPSNCIWSNTANVESVEAIAWVHALNFISPHRPLRTESDCVALISKLNSIRKSAFCATDDDIKMLCCSTPDITCWKVNHTGNIWAHDFAKLGHNMACSRVLFGSLLLPACWTWRNVSVFKTLGHD